MKFLSKAEVAGRWGCTERQVQDMWRRREITGVKIGRLVRFPEADIEAYETARTVQAVRGPVARAGAA